MAGECGLAATIASPLLECGKLVFGPIYRNTKSFFNLQSNLNSLQHKNTFLKKMEDIVKQQVEAADKDGKLPTPQVEEWLLEVREILVAADRMQPGMIADNRGLVSGCFLNCGVCRKVRMTLEEVQRLMDACPPESERVVSTNRPPPTVEHIPTPSIEDQATATLNLNRVMDALSQDEVRSVGIWGMGGVGKTTLVKNLNNKLDSDGSSRQCFGMVIWVTVSKDFNLKRVQGQIAERLVVGLTDDEDRNAVKLHKRFEKENKFLLILDDLWEAIDLDKLGIPNPQVHNGVRILITSRSKRVCENMRTDEQVQVSVLNPDEAWELFVKTVGKVANSEGIKHIAWKVCEQCCGLPLAVVIVGAAMRGKDMIPLWEDALSELQRSIPSIENVEKEVFSPLKWSFDKLQGNTIKSCFLYCSLYPEDYNIEISELVKCWMGEGLIDEELNYEESRNRGLALIQNLKEACLLEDGEPADFNSGDRVKMHDVVRDVAIWISCNYLEGGCKSLVRAGMGLSQLSQVKISSDVKRISFMNNQIDRLRCDDACLIECSNASTLFLQGNRPLVEITDRFIQQFQAIKVLNLSHTNILSLPSSFMQLTNIKTLLLRRCKELKELSITGWEGLRKLQILDLAYTSIKELPSEMARLIKLRELDLHFTKGLKSIPAGVFSMLSSLEILDMERSGYIWGLKRASEDGEAYLEELESIYTLRELFIQVKPKSSLSWTINPTWIERLRRFSLRIGVISTSYFPSRKKKEISMIGINPAEEERTEYLLSTTGATTLWFSECVGLDKLVQNMGLNTNVCFSALKRLDIHHASINLRDTSGGGFGAKYDLLPNLEEIHLRGIKGMRSISELAGHLGLTFSKLKKLCVTSCHEMKYLLSAGLHLILESLAEINIESCEKLEEVFECVAHPHGHSVGIVPNLKKIDLYKNPELRTLCKSYQAETWPSLESIKMVGCDKLRKLPISGENNSIREINGERSWWSNLEWDDPNTKTSLQPLFKPL